MYHLQVSILFCPWHTGCFRRLSAKMETSARGRSHVTQSPRPYSHLTISPTPFVSTTCAPTTGIGDMDLLNQTTLNNLFRALDTVYTSRNLLIVAKNISSLLNYLTPFSAVKKRGNFEQLLLLDELPSQADFDASVANYESIIVLVSELQELEPLKQLWRLLSPNMKVALIVQDLSRSFYYTLSRDLFNVHDGLLQKSSEVNLESTIRISPNVRLINWRTNPVLVEDFIILSTSRYSRDALGVSPCSGLAQYLHNPLHCVSAALDAVMKVVASIENRKDLIKLKNVYAKGDHASLFVNLLLNDKFPEYLAEGFSSAERDFFLESLSANADLVVLERNLDYFPLVLSSTTYSGLLSDLSLFKSDGSSTSEFYNSTVFANDEIFQNAKDLNFLSIGANLNKLARVLKYEVEARDNLTDLNEIRELVSKLGNLKLTQDLVRKHTALSEKVLDNIKHDLLLPYSHDFREKWLEAQNQIFDQDYKTQMRILMAFMNGNYPYEVVLNFATLISLINNGIRAKDIETIETQISLNYGLHASLSLAGLLLCRIIKVNNRENDFFGNFSFGKPFSEREVTTGPATPAPSVGIANNDVDVFRYEDPKLLGITGGQEAYKSTYTLISKFWNLHPVEENEASEGDLHVETIKGYSNPSFTLPAGTVPLLSRMVESLYFRGFLKYKPTNNIYKRPNWGGLNMDSMFKGHTVDLNIDDKLDDRKVKPHSDSLRQQYLIVVILGGITRSEIGAFKYLQQKLDQKLYIVTSDIINNRDLYEALS